MLKIGALSLAVTLCGSVMTLAQGVLAQGKDPKKWVKQLEQERAKLPEERAAKRDARSFQWVEVDGKKLQPRVQRLLQDLQWHKTLAAAKAESKRTGKPILWIHALGAIDGFL